MRSRLLHPAAVFTLLSLVFGAITIAVTPPLRGPDEGAHFLRAYGVSQGIFVPAQVDEKGRKVVPLAGPLYRDFAFFEAAREKARTPGFSYREVLAEYATKRGSALSPAATAAPVLVPYSGSESYSPVPYLPYAAAVIIAHAGNLDFLSILYLMRAAGLVAFTAVAVLAIARTPVQPWAFLLIAMLPSSLYGRSVISADGATLSLTLLVVALALQTALRGLTTVPQRAAWMTLCVLTKPSQIAFLLLELMVHRWRDLPHQWRTVALVTIPGMALSVLWVAATGGDIAAWRIYEGTDLPEQYSVLWKLKFMLAHPLHFPAAAVTSLEYSGELWRQLIGVLGWLDTRLLSWAYPLLTLLLASAALDRLEAERTLRIRVAAVATLTVLSYSAVVFLIFFITWTPIGADRVLGLQGRYFVMVLPLLALIIASLIPRRVPLAVTTSAAIVGSLLSAFAVLEAVLRKDWP